MTIIAEIKQDLKKIEEALKHEVASGYEIVSSAEEEKTDLLQAKLLLFSAKFGNYDFEKLLPAALAVELFGMAFKRHYHFPLPTCLPVGTAVGMVPDSRLINFSLIIGDFYYAQALSLVSSLNDVRIVEILAQTILGFARGNSEELSGIERLRELASLHQTSCRLGALIGEVDEKVAEGLKTFGNNLGMFYEAKNSSRDVDKNCKNDVLKVLRLLPENDVKKELQLLIPD